MPDEALHRMPSAFVSHGAPTLALDADKGAPLRAFGESWRRPRAVLVVSAHWEAAPVLIGAAETRPLIYDFRGFPEELRAVRYPSPGAPWLARRVASLLGPEVEHDPDRGLDHGVWTPLVHMYPEADVPVLQVSLPFDFGDESTFELGRALAPLRDEGVMILGSGNITHNLRRMSPDGSPTPAWAEDFDAWVKDALVRRDVDAILDAPQRAPEFDLNHPRTEHWTPLLVTLGAIDERDRVGFFVEGFEYGSLSRRSVAFAPA